MEKTKTDLVNEMRNKRWISEPKDRSEVKRGGKEDEIRKI